MTIDYDTEQISLEDSQPIHHKGYEFVGLCWDNFNRKCKINFLIPRFQPLVCGYKTTAELDRLHGHNRAKTG